VHRIETDDTLTINALTGAGRLSDQEALDSDRVDGELSRLLEAALFELLGKSDA
jgi:hypothetical protein